MNVELSANVCSGMLDANHYENGPATSMRLIPNETTLPKRLPVLQRHNEIIDQLLPESDRGCILVVAAIAEEAVEALLRGGLHQKNKTHSGALFGRSALISSFSAKIDVAYGIGVITGRQMECFHLLRRIRNDCAHQTSIQDFDTTVVKQRVLEIARLYEHQLRLVTKQSEDPRYNHCETVTDILDAAGWRDVFLFLLSILIATQETFIGRIQPVSAQVKPDEPA